jgi:hypothetical protein
MGCVRQAEVLVTTPFHPGYLTAELVDKVRKELGGPGPRTDPRGRRRT